MTELELDLSTLSEDGDTLELDDGRVLRLRVEPDEYGFDDISEFGDVYGRTEWTRNNDYGAQRPSDFTGRAEILNRDGRSTLWWEPYWDNDYPNGGRGETFDHAAERRNVRDILEYGFQCYGLELSEMIADSRGALHRVVVDTAWLSGVEPFADSAYVATIVSDLASELDLSKGSEDA